VVKDRYVGGEVGTQYAVEHVRRQLVRLGFSDAEINSGGLRVYTSLDLDLQAAAYRAVYETLNAPDDPAGALVAVDDQGWIRAMVGGRDWATSKVNLALGAEEGGRGRQPGSAFKPFALATAVADGYTVESAFESPRQVVFPGADNGEDYEVENFEDAAHGTINLVDATRLSSNTVYTQLVEVLGPERVAEMARRLGITSDVPAVLSIALGTPAVSVRDMAAAFLTFATRGERVEPQIVQRVMNADGRVLWEEAPARQRVLEPEEADIVTHALRQVIQRGTGTRATIGTPAAGKTGTTQGNGDAWFVGYTPRLSTAVWIGYPEGQTRQLLDVQGVPRVTGGTLPATIWRRFMEVATEDEAFRGEFPPPPDLSRGKVLTNEGRVRTGETTTTTTAPEEEPPEEEAPEEEEPTTTSSSSTTSSTSSTSSTSTSTTEPPPSSTTSSTLVPG
jgi:penicillin-binding protein 1A